MGLETGTTLADLDKTWPLATDSPTQGDDHFRLIKSVLKAQFPGELGSGFNTPIIATETEFNYLVGVNSNLQDQLDAQSTLIADLRADLVALAVKVTDLENA